MTETRKKTPLGVLVVFIFALFSAISIIIIHFVALPWFLPIPQVWSVAIGFLLLLIGFPIMASTMKNLKIHRAFGDEIYTTKEESQLVTTGVYAYTRNPLYLSATLLFFGWSLFLMLTFLLIIALLFIPLFGFVAKWEENELIERFGAEYLSYKERVPRFFPQPRRN